MELSNGNRKIGKNTLILNMTSATDCPSRQAGLCKIGARCYAMKAERQYPACRPFRRRQDNAFHSEPASEIARDIIKRARRKRTHKIKYLRFSEAGDFKDQEDVNKLSMIADALEPYGIRVYGYTARRDLDFADVSRNMTVNGSDFMVHNTFTAIREPEAGDIVCPGNCRACDLCKDRHDLDIKVIYH